MNTSGDAAEQVVRLSLEGVEVAAKITGSAAKEVSALLIAALKNRDKNKVKGRQRLTAMLRSGKELTIFTVKNQDMARFVADAKRYGVVYCVLREAKGNPQGISEIMVRAEDAAKINRIVENIKIATVSDPEAIRENLSGKEKEGSGQPVPEQTHPQQSEDDRLLDEMLSGPADRQETLRENPTAAPVRPSLLPKPERTPKGRLKMVVLPSGRSCGRSGVDRRTAPSPPSGMSRSRRKGRSSPSGTSNLRRRSGAEKVRRDNDGKF